MHAVVKNNFSPTVYPRSDSTYQSNSCSTSNLFHNNKETHLFCSTSSADKPFSRMPSEVINTIGNFLEHEEILQKLLPVSKELLDLIINDPHFKFEIKENNQIIANLDYRHFRSAFLLDLKKQLQQDSNGLTHSLSPTFYALKKSFHYELPYFAGSSLGGLIGPLLNLLTNKSYSLFLKHALYQEAVIFITFSILSLFIFAYTYSNAKKIEPPRFPLPQQDATIFSLEIEIAGRRNLLIRAEKLKKQEKVHQEFLDMFSRIEVEILNKVTCEASD